MSPDLNQDNTENEFTNVQMYTSAHQFYTGGWTCAFCGAYVTYGNEHYCHRSPSNFLPPEYLPQWQPTPQPQVVFPDPTLIELQELLKQLIEKVDLLIEKTNQ